MFVPLLLATVRMAQIKVWVWLTVLLMPAVMVSTAVSTLFPSRMFIGLKWGVLAAFFGLSVIVLFSYPKKCSHHRRWSSLYGGQHLPVAWNAVVCTLQRHQRPESRVDPAQRFRGSRSPRGTVVLQFGNSFNDRLRRCCPLHGEARMLAALEGIAGVLYIAITVALLVSAYRPRSSSA
jgi:hypothetical protein